MRELLVAVRASIRYHDRRHHFFVTAHRCTAGLIGILGTVTITALIGIVGQDIGLAAAALVSTISVIDLVVGFSISANLHCDLRRRFVELASEIIADKKDARLGELQLRYLEIRDDEPMVRHYLKQSISPML